MTAATRFISFGVAHASGFAAGLLADHIGMRITLFISGLIAAVAFLYPLASPVRRFDQPAATIE
ncbi:MAG TPA: hypothetical protein VGS17_13420 [Candidatus Limnocylindria bacterium]|nr:hypothetical protein [Candidatus Limnocylindria bacterium]